jgi:CRP/FNR family transcriptional regulator
MDQFKQLFRAEGEPLKFDKNDYIIRPRESPSGVFFIESGQVKAYDITKYHEENLLIIRTREEIFPLIWAVTGEERSIIYKAMVPTALFRISRRVFTDYLRTHPEANAPMLRLAIEMYRVHSERIFNLEYRTVRERLISFLLTMAQRFGEAADEGGGTLINVPLSQQDVASSINASRESTSRELRVLERKALISKTRSSVTLLDVAGLEACL